MLRDEDRILIAAGVDGPLTGAIATAAFARRPYIREVSAPNWRGT